MTPPPGGDPPLVDIVGLIAITDQLCEQAAAEGSPADKALLGMADLIVELTTSHFPDPDDRRTAGTAFMLAVATISVCAQRDVPAAVVGAALGAAASRLIQD